jgi:hypothetical protein
MTGLANASEASQMFTDASPIQLRSVLETDVMPFELYLICESAENNLEQWHSIE